jgi:CBS domain-containing protein
MRKNPPTISPDQTVATLVHDYIMQSDDYGFPVLEEEHLVGIVTLEDVRSVARDQWDITSVREIMTPAEDLATMTPDDSAATALEQLAGRDVRQLPVLQDSELIGLVRRRDIVKWLRLQSDSDVGGLQATRSRV